MTLRRAVRFGQIGPVCRVLAAWLLGVSWLAAAEDSGKGRSLDTPVTAPAPMPRPAPTDPKELAAAFTKPAPASLADLKAIEQRVKIIVKRVSPAVVAVQLGEATGSGVVISTNGLVLTAGHVAAHANLDVQFTFPDGRTARGKALGADEDSDTGLLQITSPGSWPCAAVGDLRQTRPGDWVLALGHPGGFDARRSLVVRLGRIIRMAEGAIQTDCTISPGDSGGPLFDMFGRVIGIHSFISTSTADNFHVPITGFRESWNRLASNGRATASARHAYIGASGVDEADGCRLSAVEKDGPAFKAGLQTGDIVLRVNGRDIKVSASLQRWVAEAEPGETLGRVFKIRNMFTSNRYVL